MLGIAPRLIRAEGAAIAPTVALSLFGLIAAGGLAFDYARLAAMDTELQNAADQAALAAASQLDRTDDAIVRATAAIQATDVGDRLVANNSYLANDGQGAVVEVQEPVFCSDFNDDDEADDLAACDETDDPALARFVVVTTVPRTANYALTPVVAAFSGTSRARAVAGVQSAICNVAPLLVCVPDSEQDFPEADDEGRGVLLKPAPANQTTWAPGNYGLLDFGKGTNGVFDSLMGLGLNGCQEDSGETEPGNKDTVTDALNTRFDIYASNKTRNKDGTPICKADGTGCPAKNTRKDLVITQTYEEKDRLKSLGAPSAPECGANPADHPGLTVATSWQQNAAVKGFTRDTCHLDGTCTTNYGSKVGQSPNWDAAGYLAANHPSESASTISAARPITRSGPLTRFDVYLWEQAQQTRTDPQMIGTATTEESGCKGGGGGKNPRPETCDYKVTKQCSFSRPKLATGTYTAQRDRRVLPIVAANCENLTGSGGSSGNKYKGYTLLKTFEIFLVEPSLDRADTLDPKKKSTFDNEIYGEVIGPGQSGGGISDFQRYSKTKPYLVR